MQNLINALNAGTTEYKESGVVTKPPTATMTRAARVLTILANENQSIQQQIMAFQAREIEYLEELEHLRKQLLEKENGKCDQSVCNGEQETSGVGSSAEQSELL